MIYLNHNLMKNYHSADGAGDDKMKYDILTSEIAKLIVNNPARVMELINEHSKNKISGTPSRRSLVKLTSSALQNSMDFSKAIAQEITAPQALANKGAGSLSADATTPAPGVTVGQVGELAGGLAGLVSGLGDLFGGKKKAAAKTATAVAEAEKAKAEAEKALYEKTKAIGGGGFEMPTWGWIAIAVVGIGGVITLIYYVKNK